MKHPGTTRGNGAKWAVGAVAAAIALGAVFAWDSGSGDGQTVARGPCRSGTVVEHVPVPEDSVLPEAGSGLFKPVGSGTVARLGFCYGALTSIFHDGTRMSAADVLYPYSFAYRWGVKGVTGGVGYDPEIDRSTALLRRRLAGVRVVGVDKTSKSIRVGDFAFVRELVLVEVYVNETAKDPGWAATAVAPPWSSVPWHVLALMEEAVARGWAAFSETGAAHSGAPWMDLARSAALKEKLAAVVAEFAARGFVPEPIKHLVTDGEARKRWAALKAFFEENGHFLVTNGPYRLKSWSPEATVLEVFRDISYPLGVGAYDNYTIPRRAYIVAVEPVDGGLSLAVEVERVEKFMRSFKIVREPLTRAGSDALKGQALVCRFVVVGDDGRVRLAGQGRLAEDGRVAIDLVGRLQPGDYTVLAALYLNGNTVGPEIRRIPYRAR